ncbi:hypothetical protein SDC9_94836 [bioreactor metagenome]|uniref:Uncharacterized protein n=1 Tax=bioreactor metagenome TaxID=1076179 RepID=A0A645AEL6_9ZZZZ
MAGRGGQQDEHDHQQGRDAQGECHPGGLAAAEAPRRRDLDQLGRQHRAAREDPSGEQRVRSQQQHQAPGHQQHGSDDAGHHPPGLQLTELEQAEAGETDGLEHEQNGGGAQRAGGATPPHSQGGEG